MNEPRQMLGKLLGRHHREMVIGGEHCVACHQFSPTLADLRAAIEAGAGRAVQDGLDRPLFSPDAEHCQECGRAVGLVWTALDELWADVTGIACFDRKAEKQGRFIRWVPQQEQPTEGRDNPIRRAAPPLHDPVGEPD